MISRRQQSPNPRMQRTPSAPLMRKPFGELIVICAAALMSVSQDVVAQWPPEPSYNFKGYNILPSGLPISQEQILRMLVPDYEDKLKKSEVKLSDRSDDMAWWYTYEAAVVSYRRANLGVPGEDFLIVAIQEIDMPCHGCHKSIFGGVDLRRRTSMGSFRSDRGAYPKSETPIVIVKKGKPWLLAFKYWFDGPGGSGLSWKREASVVRDNSGAWNLEFGQVEELGYGPPD